MTSSHSKAGSGGANYNHQPVLDRLLAQCVDQGAGSAAGAVARAAPAHPQGSGSAAAAAAAVVKTRMWSLALAACTTDADLGAALSIYEDASVAHKQQGAGHANGRATPVSASSYAPLLVGLLKEPLVANGDGQKSGAAGAAAADPLDGNVPHTGQYFAAPNDGAAPLLPSLPAKSRLISELLAALAAEDGVYTDARLLQFDTLQHHRGLGQ